MVRYFKKLCAYLLKLFDKTFYHGTAVQFVWLFGFLVVLCAFFCLIGNKLGIGEWRIVELILDPGSFGGAAAAGGNEKVFFQFIVTILGAVFFTCFLINTIGNWLERRIERYRNGGIAYDVDDHILILGSGGNIVSLVETLLDRKENSKRDIVILTSNDAEELRARIFSKISSDKVRNIYVYYGSRVRKETLKELDAFQTKSIYILGEDDESSHDSMNMKCYELLRDEVCKGKRIIDCYIVLDNLTSIQLFYQKQETASSKQLHLTVVHSLENIAQRVLVSRIYKEDKYYPALDRDGISKDSDVFVHLLVVNMSPMGYAMATTAAHLCHFPNFQKKNIRTKITFIQSDIKQELDFFLGRYRNLMKLSYWKYIDSEDETLNYECYPDVEYIDESVDRKGFLDVEWEFINGGIERSWVRDYIEHCAMKNGVSEYLTLALCHGNSETNTSTALFLPDTVYEQEIPVFVYQPGGDHMIRVLEGSYLYKNIYPFGMKNNGFDLAFDERILRARKIKYLYSLADNNKPFTKFPSDGALITSWFSERYIFQQSNLYAANTISFKLRSIGNNRLRTLTDEEIELLSETEHNRWNIERLLIGFRPYKLAERKEFIRILTSKNKADSVEMETSLNISKKKFLKHKDIAPYDELLKKSKDYDKAIVRNILEIS